MNITARFHGQLLFVLYLFACSSDALIKSLNKGCDLLGRDLNSGWNCTATNQG